MTRKHMLQELPLIRHYGLYPKTVENIDPDLNCVWAAFSLILTRNPYQIGKFGEKGLIRYLRKEGPDCNL